MREIGLILNVYSWLAIAAVLMMMFLIARFYEQKSRQRSHYRLFAVPAALFIVAAVCPVLFGSSPVARLLAYGLLWIGGGTLIYLSRWFFKVMTGGRK
jgi:hypothetical protein